MSSLQDPFFCYFLLVLAVWILRGRLALRTLAETPVLSPTLTPKETPLVSVIIPAKNEETNIGFCLRGFLAQTYSNYEIIVINDNSTDRTEEILLSYGAEEINPSGKDSADSTARLKYLNGTPTPDGWTGKNYALHQGVKFARGRWLLFTDADTRHEPESISASISHARASKLKMLTLLPRCIAENFIERLVQPTAMAFMGLWFPLAKVNNPASPVYFGNGQYLLIESGLYKKIGGHKEVAGAFLEDFALFKKAKDYKASAQCALGTEIYGTRMYTSLSSIWKGWRRIYLHAFEQNALRLMLRGLETLFASVIPFAAFLYLTWDSANLPASHGFAWGFSVTAITVILVTAWRSYGIVRSQKRYCFLHPFAAVLVTGILFNAAWMAHHRLKTHWR